MDRKVKYHYKRTRMPDIFVFTPMGWALVLSVSDIELVLQIGTMYITATEWYVAENGDLYWGCKYPVFNSADKYEDHYAYLDTVRCRWEHRDDPYYIENLKMEIHERYGDYRFQSFVNKRKNGYYI